MFRQKVIIVGILLLCLGIQGISERDDIYQRHHNICGKKRRDCMYVLRCRNGEGKTVS